MMKENYKIDTLKAENVSEVVAITRHVFKSTYLIPSVYRGHGIGEFINRELQNPFSAYRYYILHVNEEPAGYAEYKVFKETSTVFLNIIVVNNKYKNAGVGRKLLDYTRNKFISEGFEIMALDVYETNTVAMNWYKGCGFQQIAASGLYEVDFKKVVTKENEDVFVQNYPQYEALREDYGFSYLDMMLENQSIRIGVIVNDAILRGSFAPSLCSSLKKIKEKLDFAKVYYIGKESSEELKKIDNIIRMELNLNHDTKASAE